MSFPLVNKQIALLAEQSVNSVSIFFFFSVLLNSARKSETVGRHFENMLVFWQWTRCARCAHTAKRFILMIVGDVLVSHLHKSSWKHSQNKLKRLSKRKKGRKTNLFNWLPLLEVKKAYQKLLFCFFLLCHTELSVSDYNWLIVWQSTFLFLLLLSTDTKWLIKNLWANFKQVKKLIVFCLIYLKTKKS